MSEVYFSDVVAKQVDEDNHILFAKRGEYYDVYPNLIHNILAWSKHPVDYEHKGHLGNHITIGIRDDGSLDMHETVYKNYKNVWSTLPVVRYALDRSGKIRQCNPIQCKSDLLFADELWSHITDHKHVDKRKPFPNIISPEGKAPIADMVLPIKDILEWLKQKVKQSKQNSMMPILMPYVSKPKESRVCRGIQSIFYTTECLLITDHFSKTTVLLVGVPKRETPQ